MKKILITGGAGFIGYHLANRLSEDGYKVTILDDFSRAVKDSDLNKLSKSVSFIDEDLLLCKNKNIEADYFIIYHLAAVVGVSHVLESPFDVLNKNILLLQKIIEIAKQQKSLSRLVFTSTSEVYAGTLKNYGLEFPTLEETPLTVGDLKENRTSYMLSKIYGEAMCFHSKLPVTVVRPHNIYGPRMGMSHVIPELMKKVIKNNSGNLDVFSVDHKRTFCFVNDAVDALIKLSNSEAAIGEVYNIGNDDEEITMGALSKKIMKILNKDLLINPLPPTAGSPVRRCPSISKLKKDTNYSKKFQLNYGLRITFDWYYKNIFSGKEKSAK
tara:strand:- start:13332 stop:14312 length:981 start_codon:yes stop_codon:yes gene_type:complete